MRKACTMGTLGAAWLARKEETSWLAGLGRSHSHGARHLFYLDHKKLAVSCVPSRSGLEGTVIDTSLFFSNKQIIFVRPICCNLKFISTCLLLGGKTSCGQSSDSN